MSIKVPVTDAEVAYCHIFGALRSAVNQCANIRDNALGNQDKVALNIQGLIAEIAFAKQFNLYPDVLLFPRKGGCDGIIKMTRDGKDYSVRYDIKSTPYPTGHLTSNLNYNENVDIYILGIIYPYLVDFVGFAKKTELIMESNIDNLKFKDTYCLPQDKLRPIEDLFKCPIPSPV